MATRTANDLYKYDKEYHGLELSTWVTRIHQYMSRALGWKVIQLKCGSFGYDNLAVSIANIMRKTRDYSDIYHMAELAHAGWIRNYTYWRDHKPYLNSDKYTKPGKALGDKRRNELAKTSYSELPDDERRQNLLIATFIKNHLKS